MKLKTKQFKLIYSCYLSLPFFFSAYCWESSSQTSSWLSPSRLRPPEAGSHYDLRDTQQSIRRGGSTRSLQLDYRALGYSSDRSRERGNETRRRTFQWERNQSGEWERKWIHDQEEKRRHNAGGKNTSRDAGVHQDHRDIQELHSQDSCEDSSSPVYEEYQECGQKAEQNEDTESLYDTLPPTRRAYEGYPSSPPGLDLHPAQLLPPLRAWDLESDEWRSQEDGGGLGSSGLAGSGDELERLLNLVSLRARRATRTNRASTGSEPTADWDGFKWVFKTNRPKVPLYVKERQSPPLTIFDTIGPPPKKTSWEYLYFYFPALLSCCEQTLIP